MQNLAIIDDDPEMADLLRNRANKTGIVQCTGIYEGPVSYINSGNIDHILLLDISMSEMNGLDAIPLLLAHNPDVQIVMNTINNNPEIIFKALKAGAIGYLDKQSSRLDYSNVFESILSKGAFLTPSVALKIVEYFQKANQKIDKLTMRENDIAEKIKMGKSYILIADELQISINTVRMHIKNIYSKLHINSKYELIKYDQN